MQLFKCNAQATAVSLISYDTKLFWVDYPYYILYLYPSSTSKAHIRKYVKWLRDREYYIHAELVDNMYNIGLKYKKRYVVYDAESNKYKAVDDYKNFI